MANAKTDANNTAAEKVDVHIPKGYANDEPNLTICINGVNYVLPKGKTSTVPTFVAEEFYRSQRAAETQDRNIEKLLEAAK